VDRGLGWQEALRLWSQRRWIPIAGSALVLAVVVSLIPAWPVSLGPVPVTPAFFYSAAMRDLISPGGTVMIAPMAIIQDSDAEFWQGQTYFRFKQLGGYNLNNSGNGHPSLSPRQTVLTSLFGFQHDHSGPWAGPVNAPIIEAGRTELAKSGATLFIVVPSAQGTATHLKIAAELLGRTADLQSGGVEIWLLTQHCFGNVAVGPVCPS